VIDRPVTTDAKEVLLKCVDRVKGAYPSNSAEEDLLHDIFSRLHVADAPTYIGHQATVIDALDLHPLLIV
jgi:hypothetical protein